MLDHNDMLPEEVAEQQQPLIRELRRLYDTRSDDEASLARIRERLLRNTAGSLGPSDPAPGGQVSVTPLPFKERRERGKTMQFSYPFSTQKPWLRRLNALAAVIVIGLLVGSLVLVLLHSRTTQTSNPQPSAPHVKPGWTLLGQFSGTGHKKITGQNLAVEEYYGFLATCPKIATLTIVYEQATEKLPCYPTNTSVPLQPNSITFLEKPLVIHSIEVTPDTQASWQLLVFRGLYNPLLTVDPSFQIVGLRYTGYGNQTYFVDNPVPQTLAIHSVCYGSGTYSIEVYGEGINAPLVAGANMKCDGSSSFNVYQNINTTAKKISRIEVNASANTIGWQFLLEGCTHCVATPTPTR